MDINNENQLSKKGNSPRMSAKLRKFLLRYLEFEWYEVIKHDLYFHLKDKTIHKIRGMMCESKLLINMNLFIVPHESFVACRTCVIDWIKNKDGLTLRMNSGDPVPSTRKMKKQCKKLVDQNKKNRKQ